MAQPKKKKRKVRRKVRITQKARIQKKDSVSNDTLRQDTLRKAPFIINDNGLNMRIKIKRKSR